MKAAVAGVLLGLVALASCRNPHSEAERIAASARAKASAAAAIRSAENAAQAARQASLKAHASTGASAKVRVVEPPFLEAPASSAVTAWIPQGASSAEVEALVWAVLEGHTPAGDLPSESYSPALSAPPEVTPPRGAKWVGTPRLRQGALTVHSGSLSPEVIQRVVRQSFGRLRLCYENGLRTNPKLQGRVSVRFVIARDGTVHSATSTGSDLPDASVVSCVVRSFSGLSFPHPETATTVTCPLQFSPLD